MTNRVNSLLLVAACATACAEARAENDTKAEARAHFERGVAAFESKRLADAVEEFERAYRLSPAFQVLYNIGQVDVALGRHREAVRALKAYLTDGGPAVPAERRADVEAELGRQGAFVGYLGIRVEPEGVDVVVDENFVGKSPLADPVLVDAGVHKIRGSREGYITKVRDSIEVPPATHTIVELKLGPIVEARRPIERAIVPLAQPEASSHRTTYYILTTAGAVLALAGGSLALVGAHAANTARDDLEQVRTGTAWDVVKADYDAGSTLNVVGLVVTGVGVVTGGVGLTLLLTAPAAPTAAGRDDARAQMFPRLQLGRAGLKAAWSW